MDKDRMNEEPRSPEIPDEAALPAEEDLGAELPQEELEAEPAVYEEPVSALPQVEKTWDKKKKKKKSRIPRRWKPLIWAGVILLVLGLGYAAVRIFLPEEPAAEEEQTGSDYDYLVHYKGEDLASMKFEYSDGYSYEVQLTRSVADTGYTVTSYTVPGKTEYSYNPTSFGAMISALATITSANTAVEAPEDLSVYGLAEPAVRTTYTDLEGNQTVILVGDKTPVGDSYYAMLEGGDRVYVISAYNAQYMLYRDLYYRDLTITYYENPDDEVERVCITRSPEEVLEVRLQTPEEREERGPFSTKYQIKQPYDLGVNSYYLDNYLFSYIAEINADHVVVDRPEDFAAYGLSEADNPVIIEINGTDGTAKKIYLGHVAEDGLVYTRISGVTSVYACNPDDFSFINLKYGDLMDFALWTYMINDVSSVDFNLDGEEHEMKLANVTDESLDAWLDGEEISETNARMLYTRVLQIYSYDVLPEDAEPGDVAYSFTIHFNDGTSSTLEFLRITDRSFAVRRDGMDLGLYSRIADFQNIADGIRDIKIGYTLEHTF